MTTRDEAKRYLPRARALVREAGGVIIQSGAKNSGGNWVIAVDLARSVNNLPDHVGPVEIVFDVAELLDPQKYLGQFKK